MHGRQLLGEEPGWEPRQLSLGSVTTGLVSTRLDSINGEVSLTE